MGRRVLLLSPKTDDEAKLPADVRSAIGRLANRVADRADGMLLTSASCSITISGEHARLIPPLPLCPASSKRDASTLNGDAEIDRVIHFPRHGSA